MKYVPCNYCGQDNSELVNEGPDLLLDRPGNYRLVRCRSCGLIYQNPQPTLAELPALYPEDYQPYLRGVVNKQTPVVQRLHRQHEMARRTRRIARYKPQPGRLLEVGSSTGLFLATMRDQGWEVQGVEISEHAAEFSRQNHGLNIITGTLEETDLPAHHFDVVTMWDVLEHVIDPRETLARVAHVLKPDGLFVASLPNPTAYEAGLFGGDWLGWDRPRHLHIFTPTLLENYLRDAGFTLASLESFSGRLAVTLMSLEFRLKARRIPPEKWQPWTRLAYTMPLRVATWPIYRLAEAFNKTSIMTAFALLSPK